jgi:hypothetical protein
MYRIKLLLCSLFFSLAVIAQNNTNSPYSKLGYGELASSGLTANRAMGGVGYGSRSNLFINTVNPAAYSSLDSMTVMFDLALSARITNFKEGGNKTSTTNGNLDYIAFQLPLIKNMGMSFGFTPFSFVGYNVTTTKPVSAEISQIETFSGTGGINQLFGGLAYEIADRYSIGFDVNYAFGSIKHNSRLDFTGVSTYYTESVNDLRVNDVSLRYGVQAKVWEDAENAVTLGATYRPKSELDGDFSIVTESSLTNVQESEDYKFDLPAIMGAGISWSYKNQLTAGLDFTREQWADTHFYNEKDVLYNVTRFAAGASYTPDLKSRHYFDRVKYSLGANFSNSYVTNTANSYALSVGLAFPMRGNKSHLHTVFEYGNNTLGSSSSLKEQYFKFTLSASISEMWFFKRRLE